MKQLIKTVRERRKVPRVEFQGRVELDVPQLQERLEASSMNMSGGGICVRLREALDIRSSVTLRLFAQPDRRPLECAGRVAWVVQRLDLRHAPPFLYDVGVEFIDPPSRFFRQFASRIGLALKPPSGVSMTSRELGRRASPGAFQPTTINGRWYLPRLQQEPSSPNRWHLIVTVDGIPCFSQRYPSERKATDAWKRFKHQAPLSMSRSARKTGRQFRPEVTS